ncbi:oleate hydratase [[Clostridium] colinum]|uniref:oleate hydratase n=1 Tax=[Clostridium] colinum TaxID=36835 RepID=UPI0020254A2B|nr:oleate hydratase [[Clostridium] colinum]
MKLNKNKIAKIIGLTGMAVVAGAIAKKNYDKNKPEKTLNPPLDTDRKVYFVGGGIGSLAGAVYLIRDCKMDGKNINIIEGLPIIGGSNDGSGDVENGFLCRGGRMLNEETYENFWELLSTIPSLEQEGISVTEEILNFDKHHPTCSQARLVDKDGHILNVKSMGFNNSDRLALAKLMKTPEKTLDNLTIEDWFKDTPHFFETNFWYMWQTTFAFQKWSSLFEFKRYMDRMIFEFSRIETLEGVTRTRYNQYESVILPLKKYLKDKGVNFIKNQIVVDIDFEDSEKTIAKTIYIKENNEDKQIQLTEKDLCIITNGCMTDNATIGDFNTAPTYEPKNPMSGELWKKISQKRKGFGNPSPFFDKPEETNWESFTVTMKGNKLLKMIENFSGNIPGSGALMTFKDSNWLMSIVVAAQPHFKNQPMDTTIFWGYGLYTDKVGNYIKKPMRECSGKEILEELLYHLHFLNEKDEILDTVVNVIPCMMPYIDSQFQPRKMSDRPSVVPKNSVNVAFVSQFVEIPEDMVFTEEYSVRAARIAIYTLMGYKGKKICPVTPYKKDPIVIKNAIKTSFR